MRIHILIAVACASICPAAQADSPLPPPKRHAVLSPDGRTQAISDPKAGTSVVRLQDKKLLWRVPGFYWWLFVANDGKHLVTAYIGMNLIPTDSRDDLVLFTFWREGQRIEEITLKEFIPQRTILRRTISHLYWGSIEGIDARGRLKVERADKRIFYFDVTSGKDTR